VILADNAGTIFVDGISLVDAPQYRLRDVVFCSWAQRQL